MTGVKNIARNVRARRSAANLMQKELAERSGVTPAFICCLEKGEKQPSLGTLEKLAAALGCTISDLIGEDSHEPRTA